MIRNHHPRPRLKIGTNRTGRIGQDQALDSRASEEAHAGGYLIRAVTFIEMYPALSKNDRRFPNLRKHETAKVTFDEGARQPPNVGIWNNALARRMLD